MARRAVNSVTRNCLPFLRVGIPGPARSGFPWEDREDAAAHSTQERRGYQGRPTLIAGSMEKNGGLKWQQRANRTKG